MSPALLGAWNLSDPVLLARTATSEVYRVRNADGFAVLKMLTELGRHDEGAGSIALEHFSGAGAVRLLRAKENAQLLEWIDGKDLLPLVDASREEEATLLLCDVLRRLHAGDKPMPQGLVTLERRR